MNFTELKTLLDLAATYPYMIKDKGDKFEVEFFDESGDEEPYRVLTINKETMR